MIALSKKQKKRNFKIIFDFPLNHTSDQHPWFKQALQGKDNPHRGYYIWVDSNGDPYPNNWTAGFGGPAWSKEMNGEQYYLHLFKQEMPDLNWDHEPLREEMADVINYWSEKGIDGVRLDAFIYLDIDKDFPEHPERFGSAQEVVSYGEKLKKYLSVLNQKIKKDEKNLLMIGEATSADAEKVSWYTEDNMVDKVITLQHFTDKAYEKLDELSKEKQHVPLDLKKFKKMQTEFQRTLYDKGGPILFWNNHDRPRAPQKYGDMDEYRDHTAKMMATLLYLQRGIPIIYYGEEIGMNNVWFEDPGNIEDDRAKEFYDEARKYGWNHEETMKHLSLTARDSSRGIMQWTSGKWAGFTEDAAPWTKVNVEEKYNVEDQESDENSVLNYYRALIQLKKTDLFNKGDWELIETKESLYVYERQYKGDRGLVCCNFSSEPEILELESFKELDNVVLATEGVELKNNALTLPAYGACVLTSE